MVRSTSLGALALVAALTSCSNDARVCDPGATQRCVCPVGEGAQSCNDDGTAWGTCVCGETDAGMIDASQPDAAIADDAGVDAGPASDAGVDAMPTCADLATTSTVQEINTGLIGSETSVRLDGVIAMSPPFLVSVSRTGSCLWGAFVSAPEITETAPYTGLLVTSYGTMATIPPGGAPQCPVLGVDPTGSMIPDDLVPGDVLTVVGTLRSVLSPTCDSTTGDTSTPQRQIATPCLIERTGTAAVPAPAMLTISDRTGLANQASSDGHDRWAGVLVRIGAGLAAPPPMPSGTCATGVSIVDRFGTITLDGSGLAIGDRLYYSGALAASDPCHAPPRYCTTGSVSFTEIEGIHYLDGCRWTLQPVDRCADLRPASADCPGTSCAP